MSSIPRGTWIGYACLAVTAAGWALNWPFMKILLREWPPLSARGLAGVVAALILAALAAGRGQSLRVPRPLWPRLLFAAFTNVFAWMGLGTMAMKFIPVGEAALVIYTMPIWTMLIAWPLLGEAPRLRDILAIALGTAGVALLLGGSGWEFSAGRLTGLGLSLATALLFALGNVLNRTPLADPLAILPPLASVAWQVGLGCSAMLGLGLLFEKPDIVALSSTGLACLAYMTLVPMAVCYLTWFETLRRLPPVAASTGMLLVPILAIVAAAAVLGEPLGLREAAAIALTLGGVAMALRR